MAEKAISKRGSLVKKAKSRLGETVTFKKELSWRNNVTVMISMHNLVHHFLR